MNVRATLIAVILFDISTIALHAQDVRVQASVSDATIGTEEAVTYRVTVDGSDGSNVTTPSPPGTEGLTLLQTIPGTSRNVSIVNGQMSQSVAFTWTFRPVREGQARIGSTTVTVSGQEYTTDPIQVTIIPQSQRPAQPRRRDPFGSLFSPPQTEEPAPQPGERDIFIRAEPSDRTVYRNEQLTVTYRLYFREGIQLRQSRLTDSWDAEGFWREELEVDTRPVPQIVVENGLRYNRIVLKRAALFPTRAGDLQVDPLRIESEAMVPSSRDPFQSFFAMRSRFSPVELSSSAIDIDSRPLPDGAPATFTGGVGDYRMSASIDKREVEVGQSVQLTVRIAGSGNLATLDAPPLPVPAAFEVYDPRIETSLDRSGAELRGHKTFTWVLIPRSNGTFSLPPVEFSYFDPNAASYITERSDPFEVTVTGTADVPASIVATTNGLPVNDFAPAMRNASEWVRPAAAPLHTRFWVYLLLVLPLAALAGATAMHRFRSRLAADTSWARGRKAHPLSRKHLKRADELLKSGRTADFFEELERAVLGFIGNRLNVAERGLTREQLQQLLAGRGIPEESRHRLVRLLDHCDRGRFAPSSESPSDLEDALAEASELIPLMDDQIRESS